MTATETAEMWTSVPFAETRDLLVPFESRGEGWVRDHLLRVDRVELDTHGSGDHVDDATVIVYCTHGRLGRWRVVLDGARIGEMRWVDDERRFEGRVPTPDDLHALEYHTWRVHDAHGHDYGTIHPTSGDNPDGTRWSWPDEAEESRQMSVVAQQVETDPRVTIHTARHGFMGHDATTWQAHAMRLERLEAERAAGSCVGCGSVEFTLSCLASLPLVATGEAALVVDPSITDAVALADRIVLSEPFTTVRCRQCGLEAMGDGEWHAWHFTGTIAGVRWEQHSRIRATTLLKEADLEPRARVEEYSNE